MENFPDIATARHVSIDLTLKAANTFLKNLATLLPSGKKFQFVFCSGQSAEWNQSKSLWMFKDTRRIKV